LCALELYCAFFKLLLCVFWTFIVCFFNYIVCFLNFIVWNWFFLCVKTLISRAVWEVFFFKKKTNLQSDRVNLFRLIDFARALIDRHQLPVGLVLYEPVHVVIGRVVPHLAVAQLHRVRVLRLLEVGVRVAARVPPAPNVPKRPEF